MQQQDNPILTTGKEWKRFLLLALVGLPIVTVALICAYGFIVWFGQMVFWGPPS